MTGNRGASAGRGKSDQLLPVAEEPDSSTALGDLTGTVHPEDQAPCTEGLS